MPSPNLDVEMAGLETSIRAQYDGMPKWLQRPARRFLRKMEIYKGQRDAIKREANRFKVDVVKWRDLRDGR